MPVLRSAAELAESRGGRSDHLERARQLVARAVRIELRFDGRMTEQVRVDACRQCGIHPSAFRTLFPTDDALLDRINEELVEDCESRLRAGVAAFVPWTGDAAGLIAAASALARCRPLDRAGMIIRAERRLAALRSTVINPAVADAERRFAAAVTDVLLELFNKLDRQACWPPRLAVRVILDTYERSFEAWVLRGGDEDDFHTSAFVTRTLPIILGAVSAPGVASADDSSER